MNHFCEHCVETSRKPRSAITIRKWTSASVLSPTLENSLNVNTHFKLDNELVVVKNKQVTS